MLEIEYGTKNSKKRTGGGLLDCINITYIILLIVNIVGYIVVMPK
ncbi:hypothetical protein [Tepidibacter aestuarii]|nr:hypothetical protein [Tepidibacter aestuarii]CAH2213904.1 protein of unknown function [Tepidibacter aestuarii]